MGANGKEDIRVILACRAGGDTARRLQGAALAEALRDSRERALAFTLDLDDAQWRPPRGEGVNPLAWELGHIAWFGEFWILRGPHTVDAQGRVHAARAPRVAGPDDIFDSSLLPHAQRWEVPLPTRAELLDRLEHQLDACLAALPAGDDDAALYFHRLVLFHEDMHGEAFAWTRATLGLPAPEGLELPFLPEAKPLATPGGTLLLGPAPGTHGFHFDNELPAISETLRDFEIDSAAVRAGDFQRFVDAGGYEDERLWPGAAGAWRAAVNARHPQRWRRHAHEGWQQRWFDRWRPLAAAQPVLHLNAFEAEAYAAWAGRRLPSAAEWEHAARHHGAAMHWGGSVWEWTASAFTPRPGFEPGPYRDYSAPWFGDHRELRGGAFATHARMHHPSYRNFFRPERHDVFAGFRTAADTP